MRIAVNGACGRMGNTLLRLIAEGKNGSVLAAAVDPRGDGQQILKDFDKAPEADVIIDFSHHSAVGALLEYARTVQTPVVIATTGHTEEEKKLIFEAARDIAVFYSGNMSVGIAVLCNLAQKTAAVFPDADIEIVETHHCHKLDAPSGTALMLADAIRESRPTAQNHCGRSGMSPRQQGEIGIHAVRRGEIIGIHEVLISTATQTITLKHEAHDRALFAEGALDAAAFLRGKPAGLYNMKSMIG